MRRLGTLLMTASVLFALSGCDDAIAPPSNATAPPKPPEELEKLFKKPEKGAASKKVPAAAPVTPTAPE
ncbi:MAG: hypothetical protein P4L85_27750 [Paludisphaera borealis]|uniref:hypothetical protein n=1 Tax=Paludisphaera borealis TaxID=1387353 RepID=UPI0028415823|nr:hypothetical protein [Paludisphaera borealis]MDR3623179.1 hypothetical protein [Paludisphaera borealis]